MLTGGTQQTSMSEHRDKTKVNYKQLEVDGMHCIEIVASNFKQFRESVRSNGGEVSVISRYQDRGIRILDVEVSKDTKAIDTLEKTYAYFGV